MSADTLAGMNTFSGFEADTSLKGFQKPVCIKKMIASTASDKQKRIEPSFSEKFTEIMSRLSKIITFFYKTSCPDRRSTASRSSIRTDVTSIYPCINGRLSNRSKALLLVLAIGIAGGSSCRSLSSRQVYEYDQSSERIRNGSTVSIEAEELAKPLIESGETCGISVGVITPDGLSQTVGFGKTGIKGDTTAPRGDTIFEIGSLSKLFTSVLLAELVADGTLRYEDTVKDILPQGTKLSDDAAKITLYDLDTHTSGLPRELFTFQQMRYFTWFLLTGHNLYDYMDRPWLYNFLSTCELTPKAERHHVYSNLGIGLLAHLIEVKTGRKYADLLQERIFTPLKMKDTGFTLTDEQKKRLATGHAGDQPKFLPRGTEVDTWDMGEIMNPTGGLYSTTDDLLIFARAHLGFIKTPISRSLAQTRLPLVRTREEDVIEDSACGWTVDYFDNNRYVITYKHGMVAGYSAYIGLNTGQNIAVVVLYNTFNWNEKIGHNLILRLSKGMQAAVTAGK